ncbi:SRPBCC family protein [Sphingomonas sp. DBB INV C78]|uniref:SRPBCC family protein n=1 Tax=Sphingomonas sp. DBB INV C78 TaxID=3349434 RepID=UPI0036D2D59F
MNLKIEKDFDFQGARVWEVLGDFGNIAWAAPGIQIDRIGEGPGMIRRLHMPGMEPIDEVLEAIDHGEHRFSYTIPRGLPMPITDYRAVVQVEALGDDSCRVHWSAVGVATGDFTGEQAAEILSGAYGQMLEALQAHLSQA